MVETMGQIIKRLRRERELTQEDLAERLNISAPAISRWENDTTMPDISQVVPLASIFGVSTDVLFGFGNTMEEEEALEIVEKAYSVCEYGKLDTYLMGYDLMMDGLKKYPNNLILLNNCVGRGLALALPENGWLYAEKRAEEIAAETVRQAGFIISHSQNISDVLRARQILVFLYSSRGRFDKATIEAQNFPVRTDFTLYSNMARVNGFMKNYPREIICLCSDIDFSLQTLADNAARLGTAYYNNGQYSESIAVYETFFEIMNAIFKDDCPLPYHDFDSGDCHILLARSYLAAGEADKATESFENAIMYYLNLYDEIKEDKVPWKRIIRTPLVKESEVHFEADKSAVKEKLLKKLSAAEMKEFKGTKRFEELYEKAQSL